MMISSLFPLHFLKFFKDTNGITQGIGAKLDTDITLYKHCTDSSLEQSASVKE
jgi:hypothetical protein